MHEGFTFLKQRIELQVMAELMFKIDAERSELGDQGS